MYAEQARAPEILTATKSRLKNTTNIKTLINFLRWIQNIIACDKKTANKGPKQKS